MRRDFLKLFVENQFHVEPLGISLHPSNQSKSRDLRLIKKILLQLI